MNHIAEDIKSGEFKQVYLICGEEDYLCRMYRNRLLSALQAEKDSMNFVRFEGRQISEETLISACETYPFFADRRVVLVEESGFFKEKSERLPEYFSALPDYLVVIFSEKEIDRRNKLYKIVAKYDRVIECSPPDAKGLTNWILVELKKSGKTIKKSTLELFLEGAGTDLNFLSNELEKLISYTGDRPEITAQDVRAVCSVQIENRIFDMISDAAAGRREKALKAYYDLLILKEAPMRILYLMERTMDQLLRIRQLSSEGKGEKLIADSLKLHPYAVKKNLPLARKYSVSELKQAVEELVRAEEDVKTGRLPDKMSVELMLIRISK